MKEFIFAAMVLLLATAACGEANSNQIQADISQADQSARAVEAADAPTNRQAAAFGMVPGEYTFTYMQSEYVDRAMDFQVKVVLSADGSIQIYSEHPSGSKHPDIEFEGELFHHASGEIIVALEEADKAAAEVGGCTGVMVFDPQAKIIRSC
ncbi:MAG: hypothetical protein AAFR61_13770 [Bacteroidota bacterium]